MKPRTLDLLSSSDSKHRVAAFSEFGAPESWKKIYVASTPAEGWNDVTEAMQLPIGVLIRTSRVQRNGDGSTSLSEAVCFVPALVIQPDNSGLYGFAAMPMGQPQGFPVNAPPPPTAPSANVPNVPTANAKEANRPQSLYTPPPPPPPPSLPNVSAEQAQSHQANQATISDQIHARVFGA